MNATGLAFDRAGAGPPLLLIHGLGGERHVWEPVWPALVAGHDVVTVDLPGFGASPPLPEDPPPAPPALAAAVAGLLDDLGFERPAVAGNSLGGWVALELARRGRVRSVCAIAPAGLWPEPLPPKPFVMHELGRAVRPLLPALLRTERGRRLALGGTMAHPENVPPAAALRIAAAYADGPGFVAVNRAMRASAFRGGEDIRVPVTIAWCEHDRLVGPPRRMPLAVERTVLLRDCGHVPMWDDSAAVAEVVLSSARTR